MVTRAKLEALIGRNVTLATLPQMRTQLAAVLENPESSFREVGAVIRCDPVLVARVLQKANALKRTPPEPVTTITKGLRVVGLSVVGELIKAQPVINTSSVALPGDRSIPVYELWQHSLATAMMAQAIGSLGGYIEPEEYFVAGLLHDIGKVFLVQLFNDEFTAVATEGIEERTTFYHREVDKGEASHAQIGRLLAKQWDYPSKLVDAIGLHHTPQLSHDHGKITTAVHVGDMMARAIGLGWGGDSYVPPLKPGVLQLIGLQPANVHEILTRVEAEFAHSAKILT